MIFFLRSESLFVRSFIGCSGVLLFLHEALVRLFDLKFVFPGKKMSCFRRWLCELCLFRKRKSSKKSFSLTHCRCLWDETNTTILSVSSFVVFDTIIVCLFRKLNDFRKARKWPRLNSISKLVCVRDGIVLFLSIFCLLFRNIHCERIEAAWHVMMFGKNKTKNNKPISVVFQTILLFFCRPTIDFGNLIDSLVVSCC